MANISQPKVSYIVASYNHQEYVGDLIRSVLTQSFDDLELIVVDDGSHDNTARIALDIASTDSRMKVITQKNSGVVKARNKGIFHSCGEYISVIDSDDLLPLKRTQWMVEALDSEPNAALVYGDACIIDQHGNKIARFFEVYPPFKGDLSVELFSRYCFVPAISVMFRRSAFTSSGLFWGPGPNTDYLKWIELGLYGEAICLYDKQLGCWRQHGTNISSPDIEERIKQYTDLSKALQMLAHRRPELAHKIGKRDLMRRCSRCHFMGAFYAMLDKAWPQARTQFIKAFGYHPSVVNGAALISALPAINMMSLPLYRLVAKKKRLFIHNRWI